MTTMDGHIVKCTNVMWFDLTWYWGLQFVELAGFNRLHEDVPLGQS